MPLALSKAWYVRKFAPTSVTWPCFGAESSPTSSTESPSESSPSSGTAIRTLVPLSARTVRSCGRGAVLVFSSIGRIWIVM